MKLAHPAHEDLLGGAHIQERLPRLRLGVEDHEINRMAVAQSHADLRVVLEAADTGAVARARVDDHVGTPSRVYRYAFRRHDADEDVVDRALQRSAVEHRLVIEVQQGRLARALVLEPAIVMFDEPDSGLDPVRTALLCELIREVHAENGGCYLVISHDLGTARRIADFIAVLWSGKIVESGPKEELFDSSNPFVSQFLNADVSGPLSMD